MNITAANYSLESVFRAANVSPMDYYRDPLVLTTSELQEICGVFSSQAKIAAIIGLLLSILLIVWFGRYGWRMRAQLQEESPLACILIDKVLLITSALMYALIITRLYYGGAG